MINNFQCISIVKYFFSTVLYAFCICGIIINYFKSQLTHYGVSNDAIFLTKKKKENLKMAEVVDAKNYEEIV